MKKRPRILKAPSARSLVNAYNAHLGAGAPRCDECDYHPPRFCHRCAKPKHRVLPWVGHALAELTPTTVKVAAKELLRVVFGRG